MRGLVIRSDSRAYTGISRILELFEDEVLGRDAARSMVMLSRESDNVIVKDNFSIVRVSRMQIRMQRFASLTTLYESASVQTTLLFFHHAETGARLSSSR